MDIAVTGPSGRLGSELVRQGCVPLVADVTDLSGLQKAIDGIHPDVIINCASITDVDGCENRDIFNKALKVNLWGVENLRLAFGGRLIHISTDYVFSGTNGPYSERQVWGESPVNGYGWTKMGGEQAFLNPQRPGDILIRSTGLYGRKSHHDFVKLITGHLGQGKPLQVTRSLHGNQTYIPHLVEALIHIANRPDDFREVPILHVASREVISRYDFALMIAQVFGLDKHLLKPINSKIVPGWVADRPTRGGLRVRKAIKLGVPIYTIQQGLEALYGEYPPAG